MDTLTSLRVFCAVAELKSFTAAASRLDLSLAMASKHVRHLESHLGARLLNRTSRHISLTEVGALYLSQARQALDGLDEVEAAISNISFAPRGTLKLTAPMWAANASFARAMAEFHTAYPEVCLDIDFSGRIVNLVEEGFDLALRATHRDRLDPGLVARPLKDVVFRLFGSPAYLARAGRPAQRPDLEGHALLLYGGARSNGGFSLERSTGLETVKFDVVMLSGNESMLHLAALEGMGLAFLPTWMAHEDIAQGRLEAVLSGTIEFTAQLNAVYPSRKYLSAKVRAFIDFLATRPEIFADL